MKISKNTIEYDMFFPFGCTVSGDKAYFFTAKSCTSLSLNLYRNGKAYETFLFSEEDKIGDVWRMCLSGITEDSKNIYSYTYTADGKEYSDRYAVNLCGREKWGDRRSACKPLKAVIDTSHKPHKNADYVSLRFCDSVIYRLNTRGFTISNSSGVSKERRGTFYGIIDKLNYLKELGITSIELMPPYEFNEVVDSKKLNYWGFTEDAYPMSPKKSFGGDEGFTELVKTVHKEGMELITDIYFSGNESVEYVIKTIRTWRLRYLCDGVHIIGHAPLDAILKDPYLKGMKVFAENIDEGCDRDNIGFYKPVKKSVRRTAIYNDNFMNVIRAFIKGDADMVGKAINCIRDNPSHAAKINYAANVNGFSLMDVFSYDRKHNEDNGENNVDGTDFNYSWNCGVEGDTRKKNILELRKLLFKNAVLTTMLSAGTPLINSGDEMGHTRKGNNNAWCQDNQIEWINWNDIEKNKDLYDFTRFMIAFRKKYPIFRLEKKSLGSDYKMMGLPDVSFHGEDVWKVDYENYRRQFAVLYNNKYCIDADKKSEDYSYFYICYNMHWEKHDFSLPKLPEDRKWSYLLSTDASLPEGEPETLDNQENYTVNERSIVILAAK